VTFNTN